MIDQPLVSVFLPTYNQDLYVAESINSVLSQDYENIEIIVGDDFSQDKTWDIVLELQARYSSKIKVFRNERNLGITGNCNEILKRCTGMYVAFFSGDDLLNPGKISKQVSAMLFPRSGTLPWFRYRRTVFRCVISGSFALVSLIHT